MDINAVRTFVACADTGRFQEAADVLAVTQQAVSKRVAALEREVGARLFARTARGVRLTADGAAFLPHARDLLRVAERAVDAVRPGRRALRVDVVGRRLGPAVLLGGFRRAHPEAAVEAVTLADAGAAVEAVLAGTVDAAVRAVALWERRLPEGVETSAAAGEPVQLLTGPGHALADAASVRPADLAGHRIWMPSLTPGTEWAAYYAELAAEFGLVIEGGGPDFGTGPLTDVLAASPGVATFVGADTRVLWPQGHDLRRIPLRDPVPVYPHALVLHRDNPHPALAALREHLAAGAGGGAGTWAPERARRGGGGGAGPGSGPGVSRSVRRT